MDENGTPFSSDTEREIFITNYYRNIYKKPASEPVDLSGCIERFLGPEILNNKIVVESKLSKSEIKLLENPLTLAELDEAAKNATKKNPLQE